MIDPRIHSANEPGFGACVLPSQSVNEPGFMKKAVRKVAKKLALK